MRHLDFSFMIDCIEPIVMRGVPIALEIALVSFLGGLLIGLIVALVKIYNIPILKQISIIYISLFRGTPLMVQILLAYYGLPILIGNICYVMNWNFDVNNIPTVVFLYIVYSLNAGSYMSESIRAALLSVDRGQIEAGYSIGMKTFKVLRRIVFPQAIKIAIPNLGNSFISLTKETSLAFVVSIPDILGQAKIIAGRTTRFFEAYIVAAIVYWIICIICEIMLFYTERRASRHERKN
ncbi:amino acid ABC transporter permease [Peptacetobacter hiranonis]|uniref:amino acid ABC transporter permease n=1 Tax=Peptacetobacter hiranonis TaxID=89152 RepID=UPI0022E24C2F|nr:amino acid ABC transporter permease [Peptacetobacter hiranonis]